MAFLPKQRVIVPVDFSGLSVTAIGTAAQLAGNPENVDVLHVVPTLDNMSPGMEWGLMDDDSREQSVREHIDTFLSEHGHPGVKSVVRAGDPGTEIAEYAEEAGADLIVIPSHGYHGFKRFVLGSVTERVIRLATCPVLVLRRPDAE